MSSVKKTVLLLIAIVMVCTPLSSSVRMPGQQGFVARAGRYVDSFSNPAALPFRSPSDGAFMLASGYSDDADSSLYDRNLGFFQNSESSLTLSFGGRNAMFTLGLGYGLDRLQEEPLSYDMLFRMHFQLDLAYGFGPFSFGARLQGGNSMIRSDRPVESLFDFATNMFFSQFYDNPGSEYFQVGAGMMWYDEDYFTIGVYLDRLLYTQDGEVRFTPSSLCDSLSFGFSLYMPRFTQEGELRLIRPTLMVQAGNITSGSDSYLMGGVGICFQLLPDTNLSLEVVFRSYRNARENYMRTIRNDQLMSLGIEFGRWFIGFEFNLPMEYYGGDDSRPCSFTVSMRFNT